MKYIKTFENLKKYIKNTLKDKKKNNEPISLGNFKIGDYVKISDEKSEGDYIYIITDIEPEFTTCPYVLRSLIKYKIATPNIKYIVKAEDYEIIAQKYNI